MKIGAHISIAGGIEKAPERAFAIGAECFQIFSRSPRGGNVTNIDEKVATKFKKNCLKFQISLENCLIHSAYFINLASQNNRIFYGSISSLRQELETAELLGIPFVVTHIGSAKDYSEKTTYEEILNEKIFPACQKIFENWSGKTQLLFEISAGSGRVVGSKIEQIANLISKLESTGIKTGFCFDSCHGFASGYDLSNKESVEKVFGMIDKQIGIERLKFIHLNDSKTPLNSNIDRHEHLGLGTIGREGIEAIISLAKKKDIDLIIETEHEKIVDDLIFAKKI